ncbi:hypothetical protein CsSME_00003747 [Camellia sinensis var. sinensis]
MSHAYLEDLEDAIETAIQFKFFVKFKEKSTVLQRVHDGKTVQQEKSTKTLKPRAKVPQEDAAKPNIVFRDGNRTQLKLQTNEYVQNFPKMTDDQILKDNEVLIDDPKASQEDLVITQVKARVENEELVAMEAVGTEESKQPAASVMQNMPLMDVKVELHGTILIEEKAEHMESMIIDTRKSIQIDCKQYIATPKEKGMDG